VDQNPISLLRGSSQPNWGIAAQKRQALEQLRKQWITVIFEFGDMAIFSATTTQLTLKVTLLGYDNL
jgi:hypothetical protein